MHNGDFFLHLSLSQAACAWFKYRVNNNKSQTWFMYGMVLIYFWKVCVSIKFYLKETSILWISSWCSLLIKCSLFTSLCASVILYFDDKVLPILINWVHKWEMERNPCQNLQHNLNFSNANIFQYIFFLLRTLWFTHFNCKPSRRIHTLNKYNTIFMRLNAQFDTFGCRLKYPFSFDKCLFG